MPDDPPKIRMRAFCSLAYLEAMLVVRGGYEKSTCFSLWVDGGLGMVSYVRECIKGERQLLTEDGTQKDEESLYILKHHSYLRRPFATPHHSLRMSYVDPARRHRETASISRCWSSIRLQTQHSTDINN